MIINQVVLQWAHLDHSILKVEINRKSIILAELVNYQANKLQVVIVRCNKINLNNQMECILIQIFSHLGLILEVPSSINNWDHDPKLTKEI